MSEKKHSNSNGWVNSLAKLLGIFFVAPGLAFGYHRLVEKYKNV